MAGGGRDFCYRFSELPAAIATYSPEPVRTGSISPLHQRIHCGEKPKKCLEGGGSFRRSQKPQRIQEGGKEHQCPECWKTFKNNENLENHLRSHSRKNPFECLECGKSFNYRSDFDRPLRSHSGEKPFKCLECGKSFIGHSSFRRHQRIHRGEKL